MSKLKKWQKALKWKHLMALRCATCHKLTPVEGKRFNLIKYRDVILKIIYHSDNGCDFPYSKRGDRAISVQGGVSFDYRNMTHKPILQAGLRKAVRHE